MTSKKAPNHGSTWAGRYESNGQFRVSPYGHKAWGATAYRLAREQEKTHGLEYGDTQALYEAAGADLASAVSQGEHGGEDPLAMFMLANSLAKQAKARRSPELEAIADRDLREAARLLMGEGHAVEALAGEMTGADPEERLDPTVVSQMAERAIEELTGEHELPPQGAETPPTPAAAA